MTPNTQPDTPSAERETFIAKMQRECPYPNPTYQEGMAAYLTGVWPTRNPVQQVANTGAPPPEAMAKPVYQIRIATPQLHLSWHDVSKDDYDKTATIEYIERRVVYLHPPATDAVLKIRLAYAEDAAEKGRLARENAGAMELQIQEQGAVLRMAREALELALSMTCSCGACDVNYRNKVREAIAAMDAKIKPAAGSIE